MVAASARIRATSRRSLDAQRRVQGAERLVQEHHARADRQRARERDALLLAAGELVGVAPLEPCQPDQLEQISPRSCARVAARPKPTLPIDGQVREQRAVLGHVADAAMLGADAPAPVVDDPPADRDRAGVESFEAGDQPQQRRLAAARRAEHRRDRPVGTVRSTSLRTGVRAEALGHPGSSIALMRVARCALSAVASRGRTTVASRAPGTTASADDHQRIGGGRAVGDLALVRPELVASVWTPIGASTSVAVSSVTAVRNTRQNPASSPGRAGAG